MNRILLLLVCTIMSFQLLAQDRTYSVTRRSFDHGHGSLLIVPYESKMLLSDINREVHKLTGLELDEIRRLFQEGLCQVVGNEAGMKYTVLDLLNSGLDGSLDDVEYTHRSIGWEYTKVPPIDEDNERKLKRWLEKTVDPQMPDQKRRGVTVEDGELYRYYDDKERYMDTRIMNPELMTYLNDRHEFKYVLFLNQLDIQVKRIPEMELGQTWGRMVKVHYTVFDNEGTRLTGGAVYQDYDGTEKDIYGLIGTNFRLVAAQIMADISSLEEESNPTAARSANADRGVKPLSLFKRDKEKAKVDDDEDF